MVTAIDSSILLDVLSNDATFAGASLETIRAAAEVGALVVCPIVWSEVCSHFDDPSVLHQAFADIGIRFDPFDQQCADLAGTMWRTYRVRGGTRTRLIADFLVGAHAMVRGGRLLTRDRGFFRDYFDLDLPGNDDPKVR